jgi:hypothetical protein
VLCGTDLCEHPASHLVLITQCRVGGIQHVQKQVGILRLRQRRAERGDQIVGEILDESHGVADQDAGASLGHQDADGGIQRGEESVGHNHRVVRE